MVDDVMIEIFKTLIPAVTGLIGVVIGVILQMKLLSKQREQRLGEKLLDLQLNAYENLWDINADSLQIFSSDGYDDTVKRGIIGLSEKYKDLHKFGPLFSKRVQEEVKVTIDILTNLNFEGPDPWESLGKIKSQIENLQNIAEEEFLNLFE